VVSIIHHLSSPSSRQYLHTFYKTKTVAAQTSPQIIETMATGSISVHGHGVRVITSPELSLAFRPAAARVENLTSGPISPTVYFPLPSPQAETPKLNTIYVTITGSDVKITSVSLYNGSQTVINDGVSQNSTFSHIIKESANASYTNKGLSIGLKLDIPSRKYIDFNSIAISTSSP